MAALYSLTILLSLSVSFLSLPPLLHSQQPYEGKAATDCGSQDNSTSLLGYFCNGNSTSCQAFLTFHSQPPYTSVPAISSLLGADPSRLSAANSVPDDFVFAAGTLVIAPVRCGCSGPYYQANTTYTVGRGETWFSIAYNTFQGLSTCQALERENSASLFAGMRLTVPLRCACPTENQSRSGTNYLLSYLVSGGDTVYAISQTLGAGLASTLDANGLSMSNALIYPVTTLLVPLSQQPNITGSAPPPPPPPPPPSTSSRSPPRTRVYVVAAAAVLSCLLVLSSFVFCVMYKNDKKKKEKEKEKNKAKEELSSVVMISENTSAVSGEEKDNGVLSERFLSKVSNIGRQSLRVYEFEEVRAATEDFSEGRRIEGSVYRGVFDGEVAAVKMINRDVSREIDILRKISHFNVIKLQGLCFNEGHWFLVFEYAENGSLSSRIFGRTSAVLSWGQRVQIALDVASGLEYLHGYTEPVYVHKDVRSSNILLDGNMRAKIANFGMAASTELAEFAMTRHIVGTQGYMAPEYLQHGFVSPKLDVYAFGVTVAEIITGKDAVSLQRRGEDGLSTLDGLTAAAGEEEDEARERMGGFIDPQLEGEFPLRSALLVARVIGGCLRKDPGSRPSMAEIVRSLSGASSLFTTEKLLLKTPSFR
ncbi:lysM domain receptor-like kinase 4 [Iris pallida]|uniref:LysM domain receptor-like kinase 4 n=1 Tax=Iris pallida TaxID=29817 RepID=A0AAX6FB19_IRIPA|nr:lysM domain receptor-like kinase 4 [Iris pallida]